MTDRDRECYLPVHLVLPTDTFLVVSQQPIPSSLTYIVYTEPVLSIGVVSVTLILSESPDSLSVNPGSSEPIVWDRECRYFSSKWQTYDFFNSSSHSPIPRFGSNHMCSGIPAK